MSTLTSALTQLFTKEVCFPSPCTPDSWNFPLLLVCWSLILIIIALGAGFHLSWQTRRLHRTFLRFIKALQALRTSGRSMTRAGFEQVDTLLRDDPLTSTGWNEFQETILRDEKGETGEISVFNTRPAAEFFAHSEVEQRISAFHRLIPAAHSLAPGCLGPLWRC
jgi:hypothetical protein